MLYSILVQSCKGGVGKSMITAAVGMCLSEKYGHSVLILDCDISGASISRLLNVDGIEHVSDGNQIEPVRYSDKLGIVSIANLVVDQDVYFFWVGKKLAELCVQMLRCVNLDKVDVLLVDSPPGTSDILKALVSNWKFDECIVVTEPNDNALAVTRKGMKALDEHNLKISCLVVNKIMPGMQLPIAVNNLVKEFKVDNLIMLPFIQDVFKGSTPKPLSSSELLVNACKSVSERISRNNMKSKILGKIGIGGK